VGLSTEYCSTVYVAGDRDSLSWWVTEPIQGSHNSCRPRFAVPGNPAPALYKDTGIEMASALVAERQDGTRIFLRYFPTGEIQQWSATKSGWDSLARCTPGQEGRPPQCDKPLRLLGE
jgi:hypothetical protein